MWTWPYTYCHCLSKWPQAKCIIDWMLLWPFSLAMLSSPNTSLQNPMSTGGVGQSSAPTINTSTPIDPSSMQRAYAALGLPYGSQATGQAQSQQASGPGPPTGAPNVQAQQQLPQQMRSINALGKVKQCFFVMIWSVFPSCADLIIYHWKLYLGSQVKLLLWNQGTEVYSKHVFYR